MRRRRGHPGHDAQRHLLVPGGEHGLVFDRATARQRRHGDQPEADALGQSGQQVVQAREAVRGDQHVPAAQLRGGEGVDEEGEGLGDVLGGEQRAGLRVDQTRDGREEGFPRRVQHAPAPIVRRAPHLGGLAKRRADGGLLAGEPPDRMVEEPAGLAIRAVPRRRV
jgi:hypothetical protein